MWLQTYPSSQLQGKMEYYIEPAAQSDEVEAQFKRITPEQIDPEAITILDPACGSGHILVEAYDVLKEIYQERGYRQRDIVRLILEKNLYGLDIDERAAQLAGFALLMKARGDDRRILEDAPRLNVMAIEESAGVKAEELAVALLQVRSQPRAVLIVGEDNLWGDMSRQGSLMVAPAAVDEAAGAVGVSREEIVDLLQLFKEGKTLGSLISVPDDLAQRLPAMRGIVKENLNSGELYAREAANRVLPFVRQAEVLAGKYDCVIANPPYLNSKFMSAQFRQFANKHFALNRSDVFSMFVERALSQTKLSGQIAFVTPYVWMFISSYEQFRKMLLNKATLLSLIQLEYNAFEPACVPVCTFNLINRKQENYKGDFIDLSEFKGHQNQAPKTLEAINNASCEWRYKASSEDLQKLPSSPIAYSLPNQIREVFDNGILLKDIADVRAGMATGDNARFVRLWFEIDSQALGLRFESKEKAWLAQGKRWFPFNKGGAFRKWYGNNESVLRFDQDAYKVLKQSGNHCPSESYYFKENVTWSDISSSFFGTRYCGQGFIFSTVGNSLFSSNGNLKTIICLLNTSLAFKILRSINPTFHFNPGDVASVPIFPKQIEGKKEQIETIGEKAIQTAREDWDASETSWDFQELPLLRTDLKASTVRESFNNWQAHCDANIRRMQELETQNNRLFIEAYNLQDELTPEVSPSQITLARADAETDTRRLVSYAVGCMMGRYSLDKPGLIYANSANVGFDPSQYQTFPADHDGIIPVTDLEWFTDDAANRFAHFVRCAWKDEGGRMKDELLQENLTWIAARLGAKAGEIPLNTIRRYFSSSFFKDHLQTYKKRPIYWLFSSGKQKAFECLVYLHRYAPSTLSRMRNEYVTPLFGKLSAQIEYLTGEVAAATSTAARNKLQKGLDALKKKQTELQAFDDELRHFADQRIALDLDDGVKVNYGKFGNLLAEVKQVAADTASE